VLVEAGELIVGPTTGDGNGCTPIPIGPCDASCPAAVRQPGRKRVGKGLSAVRPVLPKLLTRSNGDRAGQSYAGPRMPPIACPGRRPSATCARPPEDAGNDHARRTRPSSPTSK